MASDQVCLDRGNVACGSWQVELSTSLLARRDGIGCRIRLHFEIYLALGKTVEEFLGFLKEYPYIPAIALAAFGWWWVHKLNATRDRINAERDMRNTELARVYSVLLRVGIYGTLTKTDEAGNITWVNEQLEDAIGKIYLYGTKHQVDLTQNYVQSWADTNGANGTELLNDIREHIRMSLGLPPVHGTPSYLRVEIKRSKVGEV